MTYCDVKDVELFSLRNAIFPPHHFRCIRVRDFLDATSYDCLRQTVFLYSGADSMGHGGTCPSLLQMAGHWGLNSLTDWSLTALSAQ